MSGQEITVISRKYDLSIRRTWRCRLLEKKEPLLVLVGEFVESVEHSDLGLIEKGTSSYEYYWLDRMSNVFRFHLPDGRLRNYYCNINLPPIFDGTTLDYVDLDIDLIVWPDRRVLTLDEDDFAANADKFNYPTELRRNVSDTLSGLKAMVEAREFPFELL